MIVVLHVHVGLRNGRTNRPQSQSCDLLKFGSVNVRRTEIRLLLPHRPRQAHMTFTFHNRAEIVVGHSELLLLGCFSPAEVHFRIPKPPRSVDGMPLLVQY